MMATTHHDMTVTLSSTGELRHSEQRFVNGAQIYAIDEAMHLGKGEKLEWRVVGQKALVNNREYKSFWRAILVTLRNGECIAQVSYKLKTRFDDYQYTLLPSGIPAVARSIRADNVTCTIQ